MGHSKSFPLNNARGCMCVRERLAAGEPRVSVPGRAPRDFVINAREISVFLPIPGLRAGDFVYGIPWTTRCLNVWRNLPQAHVAKFSDRPNALIRYLVSWCCKILAQRSDFLLPRQRKGERIPSLGQGKGQGSMFFSSSFFLRPRIVDIFAMSLIRKI